MARSPSKETAEATPKTDKLAEARGRNLDLAIQQIQKDYGEGAILRMGGEGIKSDISVIPTGNLLIDQALGTGQAKLHCLHQALAAGQVAGVGALSGSDRGIDRCRPLIIECVHG